MCDEVFSSLGAMIGLVENCAQMTGKLARVSEMLEVLDELDEQHKQPFGVLPPPISHPDRDFVRTNR